VKPLLRQAHLHYGYVGGQYCVQCPVQIRYLVPPLGVESNNLPAGMHAAIGPAGAGDPGFDSRDLS
jgi:hypothetical protein